MPEDLDTKPAVAGMPAETCATDPRRRGLLRAMFGSFLGLGFTALGAAGGLWAAGTARFLFPNVITKPPSRFKAGFPGDYPAGRVETRYKDEYGVWLVSGFYNGKRQIYALRTACTHLGCITIWQEAEQKFKCPCHGSGFSMDGVNFEGPAPRPLERYAIRIADDGQLEVDTSRIFQEELGQWTDPGCYVPA
ncbi:MAG: ubiquinol-cytochrome c reductase iron-sulfur subunit [Pirellulales bacterium]|nr:ubiquinol-cytochrome c reductase iron-sulfur subunit [Pirellulales bacterium]